MVRKKKGNSGKGLILSTIFICASVIGLDQLTKYIVSLSVTRPIQVIPGVLRLILVENTGAGFGILKGRQSFLILISCIAVVVFIYMLLKIRATRWMQAGIILLLSGTIGNLIDRVRLGYVVDFIDFPYWPAFNIADSAISVGAVILGIMVFLERKGK